MKPLQYLFYSKIFLYLLLPCASAFTFAAMHLIYTGFLGGAARRQTWNENLGTHMLKRTRFWKIKQYSLVAGAVLTDVHEAIQEQQQVYSTIRTFLPLLVDVRKKGESLLATRSLFFRFLDPLLTENLPSLVREVSIMEEVLKMLPKSNLTLEDVLAGKFD